MQESTTLMKLSYQKREYEFDTFNPDELHMVAWDLRIFLLSKTPVDEHSKNKKENVTNKSYAAACKFCHSTMAGRYDAMVKHVQKRLREDSCSVQK